MITPILFLVFNRPECTSKVFNAIKNAKPSRLYVACDGPRDGVYKENEIVKQVRNIATNIDWPCELNVLFREENLGCKLAVSSAIDWFFQNESEGIILEDDCLPHPDFFRYCNLLLERYRDDQRIGFVAGTALCDLKKQDFLWGNEDYIFSSYPSVWGWATWRRVWQDYQVSIPDWPNRRKDISALTTNLTLSRMNGFLFDRVYRGEIDTWDYQVSYMLWRTSRLVIIPSFNLVENIGFGFDATHTKNSKDSLVGLTKMGLGKLSNELIAPPHIMPNKKYKDYIESFATRPFYIRVLEKIRAKL